MVVLKQTQFSRKTKSRRIFLLQELRLYTVLTIVFSLYYPNFIINIFPKGLQSSKYYQLYIYYYANAIFQENWEEQEESIFHRNKGFILLKQRLQYICPNHTVHTFSEGLHLFTSYALYGYYHPV